MDIIGLFDSKGACMHGKAPDTQQNMWYISWYTLQLVSGALSFMQIHNYATYTHRYAPVNSKLDCLCQMIKSWPLSELSK